MKRKLLLICVCLFGALSGVKAWTSQTPSAGNTYYLYHPGLDQFLFMGLDDKYGVTPSVFNATPIYVETGTSGNSDWTFSFVIRNVKYYIYQNDGNSDFRTDQSSSFEPKWSDGIGKYRLQTERYKPGIGAVTYRMLHAGTSGGQCSFEKYESSSNNGYEWQFISESEVESARSAMAESCASSAASYATTSNGWERVTSISALQTNPENYYYAIFCANATNLMLQATSNNSESQKPYYRTATNPTNSSEYLFEIENHVSGGFALKSCAIGKYFSNATAWDFNANQASATSDNYTNLTLTYANGAYTIETAQSTNYVGLWDLITDWYSTGKKLAGNKQSSLAGKFLIYRLPKQRLRNVDFTQCITNPSFDGNADYWDLTSSGDEGYHVFSWVATGGIEEYNRRTFKCEQTINNLPNGIYKIAVQGYYRGGGGGYSGDARNAKLFAKDEEVDIMSINDYKGITEQPSTGNWTNINSSYFVPDNTDAANYVINTLHQYNNEVTVAVSNGTLKIGVKKDAEVGSDWTYFDNFTLTYIDGLHDLTPVSGNMNAAVNTAQQNAVSTYNSNKTVANYIAAMDAIAAAEVSKAAYANAAVYLSNVEALLATTNFYTSDAYNSVYGTYKTAYDAGTLDDATAAGLTYKVASHTPSDQRYTDNTANDLLIPGWTFGGSDATTSGSGFYINTWSTEDNSNGFANPFYEYWVADNSVLGAKKIVGTLSGLTANKYYKVTAKVRVRETNSSTKVANSITMQVGSGDKVDVTAGTQISTTQRYVGQFSAIGQADEDGNLVLTFDVASGSNISWLSFRDVNYSDPTPEAKAVLLSTINDANTLYNSGANVGSGVFQIPTAAGTTFSNAIATAQGVYDNASSTYEEVLSANSTLQTAITTYEGVTLNAPTVGTRYKLTLADRGTLTYQTASTEGGYGMPFKAAGDYMAQTFTFTQVSGNTYTMSFEDFDGNTRYICTRAQYGSGGTGTYGIRSFVAGEGGKTALPITIKATTTANVFNMLNTECDNKKLGSNGGDFYTDNAYTSWSIAEATQAEVTVSCKAGKYGTVIFPFTPDVSEGFVGITFYSCEDINTTTNNVLIESVDEPQANTPYIIKNANGSNFSTILTGWGTSATTEHTAGLLTGVYTDAYIPVSDASNSYYVLQTKDDVQAFYKVEDADFPGTPYKCYLTIPAATPVKAFLFPENPTAINAIEAAENENTEIYNLAGQRLSKAQKGVNIINGKKVLVK